MDKLPEKVIQLDAIRIDYGRKKSCRCLDPKFTLDVANRLVTCDGCGSICDPFDVLRTIARRDSRRKNCLRKMKRYETTSHGER